MDYKNFALVDDKYIPLYKVVWVAATPHFCGNEDCEREGQYEIHLENDEAVWGSVEERDSVLKSLEQWSGGPPTTDENWEE